jgi:uncharacterized protein (TIGR02596 family)
VILSLKNSALWPTRRAFTLVEMLVVLAIVAILSALSIRALSSIMNSYNLTSASQTVLGQLTYARQNALANNRAVQIRFYQIADYKGNAVYRAVQAFLENTDSSGNTIITPITKPYFLPTGIWMVYSASAKTASTLLATSTSGAGTSMGDTTNPLPLPYGASPYIYFHFRPTGQTDLSTSSLLTIARETDPIIANNLPANFITLQIDAVNGNVQAYQP